MYEYIYIYVYVYVWTVGVAKLCNNLSLAISMIGTSEAMALVHIPYTDPHLYTRIPTPTYTHLFSLIHARDRVCFLCLVYVKIYATVCSCVYEHEFRVCV